jgi:hypothetical protein
VLRLRAEEEDGDDDGDDEDLDDDNDDDNAEPKPKHAHKPPQTHRLNLHDVFLTLKDPKCYLTAVRPSTLSPSLPSHPTNTPP